MIDDAGPVKPRPWWRGKEWKDLSPRERKTNVIGCLVALFLCGVCGVYGNYLNERDEAAAVPTKTAEAISARATGTAEAVGAGGTATAAQAGLATVRAEKGGTQQARDRAARTAAAQPTDADTAQVVAYAKLLSGAISDIGDTTPGLSARFSELADAPIMITDQDWRAQTAVGLGLMQGAAQRIVDADVPAGAANLGERAKSMASKVVDATHLYAQGLDDIDPDKIARGGALLSEAAKMIPLINDGLAQLKRSYSIP